MSKCKSSEDLIQNPKNLKPHVVLLGAGASRAAFLKGDKNGKILPLMDDFVQVLGLGDFLTTHGIETSGNFEDIYSNISDVRLKTALEEKIFSYFSSLELPDNVTYYDRLLLSLRKKDVIFTFNWDPLLANAYMRNQAIGVLLPELFFLHGNVQLFSCIDHFKFNFLPGCCNDCGQPYKLVPLLYPVRQKDYFNANNYIKVSWEQAIELFRDAFTITIFGYGAPDSDVEAVKLLNNAWMEESPRKMEHIEIIDTDDYDTITKKWKKFAPTGHYRIHRNLRESRLWKWPRRSCESLYYPMMNGIPCEEFPLSETEDHEDLQNFITSISNYE